MGKLNKPETLTATPMSKPHLALVGLDGNSFSILGRAKKVAKKAGWSWEEIDKFINEATRGNYDHLLATVMDYFDVS